MKRRYRIQKREKDSVGRCTRRKADWKSYQEAAGRKGQEDAGAPAGTEDVDVAGARTAGRDKADVAEAAVGMEGLDKVAGGKQDHDLASVEAETGEVDLDIEGTVGKKDAGERVRSYGNSSRDALYR